MHAHTRAHTPSLYVHSDTLTHAHRDTHATRPSTHPLTHSRTRTRAQGHVDAVRALLRAGAFPAATGAGKLDGKTPYHVATAAVKSAFSAELVQVGWVGGWVGGWASGWVGWVCVSVSVYVRS